MSETEVLKAELGIANDRAAKAEARAQAAEKTWREHEEHCRLIAEAAALIRSPEYRNTLAQAIERAKAAENERDNLKAALRDIAGIARIEDMNACYQIECIVRATQGMD